MESIPTDNARLTAAIRDGSREAFDEMCGRYYAPLMAYARLFLKETGRRTSCRTFS